MSSYLNPSRGYTSKLASSILLATTVVASIFYVPVSLSAEDTIDSMFEWRWTPPFHLKLPADWHPLPMGPVVAYYAGRHPELKFDKLDVEGISMSEQEFADHPALQLIAGVERMPPMSEGESLAEAFREAFESDLPVDEHRNFTFEHEPADMDGMPATLIRMRMEVISPNGAVAPAGFDILVANEPEPDGRGHRMIAVQGSGTFLQQQPDLLKTLVVGVDRKRVPFLQAREQPVVSGMERAIIFQAEDGTIGMLDNRLCKLRIGGLEDVSAKTWGQCTSKELLVADETFDARIEQAAFDSQKRPHLVSLGLNPSIQVFEPDGHFVRAISLASVTKGDDNLTEIDYFRVENNGDFLLAGSLLKTKQKMLYRLTADGSISERVQLPYYKRLAAMPDSGFILTLEEDGHSDRFLRIDTQGKEQAQWSVLGIGMTPLPGDRLTRAGFDHLATDAAGRIYAYDYSDDIFWIYSRSGRLEHLIPFRPDGGVSSVAVTPEGNVLTVARRGAVLHVLDNNSPVRPGSALAAPADVVQQTSESVTEEKAAPAIVDVVDTTPIEEPVETIESQDTAQTAEPVERVDTKTGNTGASAVVPELVALASEGRLNVRALRAFGRLTKEQDALALRLRNKNLDLYAADLAQLRTWLDTAGTELSGLQEAELKLLQELVAEMRRYADAEQN